MAATDIQYGGLDPVLYTPDFSFLKYVLDKNTANYEKGLQAASSSYNNLKRKLTDPTLVNKRDQYLKDIEGQLQTIGSSDFSLQQNVNYANSIFEPLATDKAILFDAYITKQNDEQNQIMNDWANSSDPEIRKRYNPDIQRWMNRDIEILRNGKGDLNNYKKIENRKALAYLDPQEILAKAAKDQGFQFKIDIPGQPYITTIEGGKTGVPSYIAFSQNVLNNDQAYKRQQKVLGQATSEDILDAYKKMPGFENKSDYEKYFDYAKQSRTVHKTNQESYLKGLEQSLNKEDADLALYTNINQEALNKGKQDVESKNNGTEEAQKYLEMMTRISNRKLLKKELDERKVTFEQTFDTKDDDVFAKEVAKDPLKFFTNQVLEKDVQTFSNIKSASVVRKINPDRAYVSMENAKLYAMKNNWDMIDDMEDNYRDQEKINLKSTEVKLKGQKTKVNEDGTTSVVEGEKSGVTFGSASATQLSLFNSMNAMKEQLIIDKNAALQAMIGPTGALSSLTSMDLTNEEVGKIKQLYAKQLNSDDPTKPIVLTKEDKTLLTKFSTKLAAFVEKDGVKLDDIIPNDNFTVKEIPFIVKKALANHIPRNMNEVAAIDAIKTYEDISQKFLDRNNIFKTIKSVVNKTFSYKQEYKNMFKKDEQGNLNLISTDDIEKEMPSLVLMNAGNKVSLSKKQLADLFIQGKLNQTQSGDFIYNDEIYGIESFNGVNGMLASTRAWNDIYNTKLTEKYGTSAQFADKLKKINEEVYNNIPEYKDKIGMMLSSPRVILTGKTAEGIARELGDPSLTNANIWEYKDGSPTPEQVETDVNSQQKIRDAMKDEKNIASVTVFPVSSFNNGGMAVSVTFKDTGKTDDKKQIWEGRSLYFPINLNKTTPEMLRMFAKVKESGEFEQYKKEGKDYVYDVYQSMGIKYIVHPNMPGDTESIVEILHQPWDPIEKKYKPWEPIDPMNPTASFNTEVVSFPEMKQIIYKNNIYPHVQQYIKRLQDLEATKKTTNSTPFDLKSLLN